MLFKGLKTHNLNIVKSVIKFWALPEKGQAFHYKSALPKGRCGLSTAIPNAAICQSYTNA